MATSSEQRKARCYAASQKATVVCREVASLVLFFSPLRQQDDAVPSRLQRSSGRHTSPFGHNHIPRDHIAKASVLRERVPYCMPRAPPVESRNRNFFPVL